MVTKIKMVITPDLSRRVQKIVFNNGGKWKAGNVNIDNTLFPYLYLNKNKLLTFESKHCKEEFDNCKFQEISAYDFIVSQGEQRWLPKFGEEVEFTNNKDKWYKRKFGQYIPQFKFNYNYIDMNTNCWKYCRQIKQTKTITIDGKDIEISNECFESLKEQLLKGE